MNKNCIIIFFIITFGFSSVSYSQDSVKVKTDNDNCDVKLFRSINNYRTPFLNSFLNITDRSMLPVSIAVPAGLLLYGRLNDKTYEENTGYLMGISLFTNTAVTIGLKYLINKPRPYAVLSNVHYSKAHMETTPSFPSGHTSTTFAVSTMLALRYPKYPQAYIPVYLWSLIIAYGRPYWGMHYPTDLLGGAVVGTLSSVFIFSIRRELFKLKNNILNEKNKPDANSSNSLGIITAAYIISITANEFLFSNNKIQISFSPADNERMDGISIGIKFK